MTKVDVISGFLGSGKTTLIKGSLAKGTNKTQLEYEFDWKEGQTIHL